MNAAVRRKSRAFMIGTRSAKSAFLLLGLSMACVTGCTPSPEDVRIPVEGTVLLGDKPLTTGLISRRVRPPQTFRWRQSASGVFLTYALGEIDNARFADTLRIHKELASWLLQPVLSIRVPLELRREWLPCAPARATLLFYAACIRSPALCPSALSWLNTSFPTRKRPRAFRPTTIR